MSVEIAAQNIAKLKRELDEMRRSYNASQRLRLERDHLIESHLEDRKKFEWLMEKTGWNRYRIWQEMIKEEKQ